MFQLCRAFFLMLKAHRGQRDKGGKPYFLHPLRVARSLTDRRMKTVALLHDIAEDCPGYQVEDFSFLDDDQREALHLLTHDKTVDYFDYIRAIRSHPIARAVKQADLRDNMDLSRLPHPGEEDRRRQEKYRRACELLSEESSGL